MHFEFGENVGWDWAFCEIEMFIKIGWGEFLNWKVFRGNEELRYGLIVYFSVGWTFLFF